jgi:hypothetical protein
MNQHFANYIFQWLMMTVGNNKTIISTLAQLKTTTFGRGGAFASMVADRYVLPVQDSIVVSIHATVPL